MELFRVHSGGRTGLFHHKSASAWFYNATARRVDARTADQIQQLDVDELFERLNLDEHLSSNRHIGVYAIVE